MKRTTSVLLTGLLSAMLFAVLLANQAKETQAEVALQAAMKTENVDGDLRSAIEQYGKIAALPGAGRGTVATALLRMGQCYEKLGSVEATKAYERVVREFADQKVTVAAARARLAVLGQGPSAASGLSVRRVWADAPRYGAQGKPSRDGAYLTFRTAGEDLAIRDLATGQIRQLTKHQSGQSAWNSVPSPDGKQIAYLWREADAWELRVIGLEGAEPRVLCHKADADVVRPSDAVRPFPADWSPDGTSILIVLWHFMDPGSEIALVSARDGSMRVLKDLDKRLTERPRFSPDGRFIVFDRQQRPGEKSDIFVLALDGGREIPLIEHPANDMAPDWMPDGKGILFFSDRTGTMSVWWIPFIEGSPRGAPELLKPDVRGNSMGFTRNGSYYYSMGTDASDGYIAELDLTTGKLNSAPRAAEELFIGSNGGHEWSPDGRQMLFVSMRGPGASKDRAIPCIRSTVSEEVRVLSSKLVHVSHVRWAPDGRSVLALATDPASIFGAFRFDVQTGDILPIPMPPEFIGWLPAMSQDGKAVYYQAALKDPRRYSVMERDLETGKDQELYSGDARFRSRLTLSPDGRQLAFVLGDQPEDEFPVIKIMPAAGGEARDVLRGVQLPLCEAPIAWTPDGASLLFIKQLGPTPLSKTELWSVSVRGGEPRKLGLAVEGMIHISLHPDGRHIAFTKAQNRDEVWVMENFLPPAKAVK